MTLYAVIFYAKWGDHDQGIKLHSLRWKIKTTTDATGQSIPIAKDRTDETLHPLSDGQPSSRQVQL